MFTEGIIKIFRRCGYCLGEGVGDWENIWKIEIEPLSRVKGSPISEFL